MKINEKIKAIRKRPVTKVLWWTLALAFPLGTALASEVIVINDLHSAAMYLNPGALLYSTLLISLLYAGLWLLFNAAAASGITGILVLFFATANYFKIQILGMQVFPSDFVLLIRPGELASVTPELHPTFFILFFFAMLVVTVTLLAVFRPLGRRRRALRCVLAPVLVAALLLSCLWMPASTALFRTFGIDTTLTWNQMMNYRDNGLLGSFFVNVLRVNYPGIPGYSEKLVQEMIDEVEDEEITTEFTSPDIVVVLSEAFFDVTKLKEVTFSADPMAVYHSLSDGGIAGEMVSPTIGGGTVRPEFELLTGLSTAEMPAGIVPYEAYFSDDVPSFVSYLGGLGYETTALHPYIPSFYNRDVVYPLLGFDAFYCEDTLPARTKTDGLFVSDDSLADNIETVLDGDSDKPQFVFAISMQNHGPYDGYRYKNHDISLSSDALTDTELAEVSDYTQGVVDANAMIEKLWKYIQNRQRPTVLLVFGDHLPTLGTAFSLYAEAGLISTADSTQWTKDEMCAMYSTPYLILANDERLLPDSAPERLSPYQLLPVILDANGAPSNVLRDMLRAYRGELSVGRTGLYAATDGTLLWGKELTPEQAKYPGYHWLYTYDVLFKNRYIQNIEGND